MEIARALILGFSFASIKVAARGILDMYSAYDDGNTLYTRTLAPDHP